MLRVITAQEDDVTRHSIYVYIYIHILSKENNTKLEKYEKFQFEFSSYTFLRRIHCCQ